MTLVIIVVALIVGVFSIVLIAVEDKKIKKEKEIIEIKVKNMSKVLKRNKLKTNPVISLDGAIKIIKENNISIDYKG